MAPRDRPRTKSLHSGGSSRDTLVTGVRHRDVAETDTSARRLRLRNRAGPARRARARARARAAPGSPARAASRSRRRGGGAGRRPRRPLEALADTGCELRLAEHAAQREPADGDDEAGPQQLELPVAPGLAQLLLARRRRPVAAAGRRAARDSSASPRRSRTSRRTRPRRARASGGAPAPRGRATAAAPRPRRSPAPARRDTRAGRRTGPARAATRAGTRPRRTARQRAVARWSEETVRQLDAGTRHTAILFEEMRERLLLPEPGQRDLGAARRRRRGVARGAHARIPAGLADPRARLRLRRARPDRADAEPARARSRPGS